MPFTPRTRVLAALNHQLADRVAIDFGGHRSSGIMAIAYAKLRRHLGLPQRPVRVYDMIQQLAIIDADVLDRFNVDTIELGRGFALEDKHWKPWTLPDGTPCQIPAWLDVRQDGDDWLLYNSRGRALGVQKKGSLYFEQIYYPFADDVPDDFKRLPDAMADVMWALPSPPEPGADLAAGARRLRASTDRAIIGLFGGNLMEWGQFLCRNDNFLLLLAAEPDKAHTLLDALVEIHLANLDKFLRAAAGSVDIILFGDDLGMQTGPQVSPQMFREFFKERYRTLWKRAKELADVKVMLHCCGGVRELLDDLIDAGLDAINPVQITCRGMEPAALKRDFGQRITFWGGGCDTREILPRTAPAEVRAHVQQQFGVMSPGGGFVFQQVHNIMSDVPPENIVAMFDALAPDPRPDHA